MKIKKIKPSGYKLKIEMTHKEAIDLIKEIGEFKQGEPRVRRTSCSKIFMILSDTLQDLDLIPMIPNRNKGDNSYPRLRNDNVWVEELNNAKRGEAEE